MSRLLSQLRGQAQRALKAIDLQGPADKFPRPAEVLVDASSLTVEEKALILYRHARAAVAEAPLKSLVRSQAVAIIGDVNFTPERIRRFVHEVLPKLPSFPKAGKFTLEKEPTIRRLVLEAIRNPTKRMRSSFGSLQVSDKWLLIALLESGYSPSIDVVRERYEVHCPAEAKRPIEDLIDELRESFIKEIERPEYVLQGTSYVQKHRRCLDWIHPSYRDLVIDELRISAELRNSFLAHMGVPGVVLALSDAGGRVGERIMPLMADSRSWELLEDTVERLAGSVEASECRKVIAALADAAQSESPFRVILLRILRKVLLVAGSRWNLCGESLDAEHLQEFVDASLLCPPLVAVPALEASWNECFSNLEKRLQSRSRYMSLDCFKSWVELIACIANSEPRFFRLIHFPESRAVQVVLQMLAEYFTELSTDEALNDDKDQCDYEASRLMENINLLKELLVQLPRDLVPEALVAVPRKLSKRLERIQEHASELVEPELTDDDGFVQRESDTTFDIKSLFEDL